MVDKWTLNKETRTNTGQIARTTVALVVQKTQNQYNLLVKTNTY